MYNITRDSEINFCKTFKVFNNCHQISNGDWITSVCACMSGCKCSTRMSFTHTGIYWYSCQCECSFTALVTTASFYRPHAHPPNQQCQSKAPLQTPLQWEKVKVKDDIALHGNPISELRDVTCHMGSHSVTCHLTQVKHAPPNPSHAGWYSIYLPRRDGRLSWHSWLDSAPAGSGTSDLSITSPTLNHCTTKTNGSPLPTPTSLVLELCTYGAFPLFVNPGAPTVVSHTSFLGNDPRVCLGFTRNTWHYINMFCLNDSLLHITPSPRGVSYHNTAAKLLHAAWHSCHQNSAGLVNTLTKL